MRVIAVLDAGTIGAQIIYVCAQHGYEIRLWDHSPTAFDAAANRHREWPAQRIPTEAARQAVIARIGPCDSLETAVTDADLVIDALPEYLPLKRRVFAQLDDLCPPEVMLASNSSSLCISRIETGVRHRHRVSNLHSTFPNWIGTEQVRLFQFVGD